MSLHITSDTKSVRKRPTTKGELQSLIKQELKHQGPDADLNFIDVSSITDMSYLFYRLDIRNIKIDSWDTSNVTNMADMFWDCQDFTSDLSSWNVSNVMDMSYMFCYCPKFNSDLSKWDVSKVRDMSFMFTGCKKFNCDLSNWKLSENFSAAMLMFNGCESFSKKNKPKSIVINDYESPIKIADDIKDMLANNIRESVDRRIVTKLMSSM